MSLLVAFALLLGPVIDYEPDGARMEVLLEDLSKKLERKLVPSAEVRDDVLVISARSVNPDELLDKMAEALEATWDKKGETWTLIRTPEQRKARTVRTERQTKEWVRAAWQAERPSRTAQRFGEKEAEALAMMATRSWDDPASIDIWERSPHARTVAALRACLGPEALAALPLGRRIVFSSKPNKMQRPIPGNPEGILRDLEREQALLEAAFERLRDRVELGTASSRIVRTSTRKPTEALIVARRLARDVVVQPVILDQNGLDLADGSNAGGMSFTAYLLGLKVDPALPNTEVQLLPESEAWLRMTNGSAYGARDFNSTELGRMFRQCTKRDPLSLVFTETVRAYSRAVSKPVALAVTDGTYLDMMLGSRQVKITVRTFDATLKTARMELRDTGAWRIGLQPFPHNLPYERFDRKATEEFAKAWDVEGTATLESAASLAVPQPMGSWNLLGRVLSRFGPGINASQFSAPLLKLYGLAPPTQKAALRTGRSFRLSDFNQEQQKVLSDAVLNVFSWKNDLRFDEKAYAYTSLGELQAAAFRSDITEILPDGLPPDAPISLNHVNATIALMKGPDGLTLAYDPSGLADNLERARQGGADTKFRFKMGVRTRWDLSIGLNRAISKHVLYDEIRSTGDWVEFDKLQADFRMAVEESIKQRDTVSTKGGGKPPPP